MTKEVEELQNQLLQLVMKEIKAGNRHKAVELAISSYFLSKGLGSRPEEIGNLHLHMAFAAFLDNPIDVSKLECSFCGKNGKSVRLGAGPHAYICEECVAIFTEHFKSESK